MVDEFVVNIFICFLGNCNKVGGGLFGLAAVFDGRKCDYRGFMMWDLHLHVNILRFGWGIRLKSRYVETFVFLGFLYRVCVLCSNAIFSKVLWGENGRKN